MPSELDADQRRRALFRRLPALADLVPFVALADGLPTPTEPLVVDGLRLWVKRDDVTASRYGGNKVRKLEFVLPPAVRRGGPVLTAGGIGSHHVLATATYASQLGLSTEAVVYPQPLTEHVADVAAGIEAAGVRLHRVPNAYAMPFGLAARLARPGGRRPYLVMPGGSTPVGTLGYVSAGLELVEAFTAGGWPEPDCVVAPLGSAGTAVGLALGLLLGGWSAARVVAVRVTDATVTNPVVTQSLGAATAALLAAAGGVSPLVHLGPPGLVEIDGRWLGDGYGHPTDAGERATESAARAGLTLDPTYTAKAFAAALARAEAGADVVYVHTLAPGH